ncbi:hypothetical protein EVAR_46058_1 [Eumeta japonica]|uniref:Uncharacterized protein n=1 Tax=Eumeta variegata TaxID=151549 RepID=A0A4C2A979_EUMVA|nr:hypothetical protein EVAR_46058_1 [Eumeta japonica]
MHSPPARQPSPPPRPFFRAAGTRSLSAPHMNGLSGAPSLGGFIARTAERAGTIAPCSNADVGRVANARCHQNDKRPGMVEFL